MTAPRPPAAVCGSDLYTIGELVARWPAFSRRHIEHLLHRRRLGCYRVGRRVFISEQEFAAFIAVGRVEPTQ
ncbi:DNA binding domain-containing protein, excisionase family [Geodermatophilus obscurus]|uniref:DNA binding domain-containing protein, excisionase family n=1 Tax=Geodermatophilus obscurus TaxID=1861 RepID=A0A1I5GME5_9ACTN|nr:helix-turn-helix domain-containing protein [Geodermatophilus obscurus]SFO37122.1 DNA binding domain-containing protein, excisionase family [Geodermatophilus obscurus]